MQPMKMQTLMQKQTSEQKTLWYIRIGEQKRKNVSLKRNWCKENDEENSQKCQKRKGKATLL